MNFVGIVKDVGRTGNLLLLNGRVIVELNFNSDIGVDFLWLRNAAAITRELVFLVEKNTPGEEFSYAGIGRK